MVSNGFNPSEKYAQVKLEIIFPRIGVNIKKIFELPPARRGLSFFWGGLLTRPKKLQNYMSIPGKEPLLFISIRLYRKNQPQMPKNMVHYVF